MSGEDERMEGEALRAGVEGGGGCWLALPKLGMNRFDGAAFGSGLSPLAWAWAGAGDLMMPLAFLGEAGKKRLRREGLEGGAPAPFELSTLASSEPPMRAKASL